MNFYNPYFYSTPYTYAAPKVGLFTKLLGGKKLTFGAILNGTQRILNFANQAIPVAKQATPMIKNAKTMLKVMNEFKKGDKSKSKMISMQKNNSTNKNNVVKNVQNTEVKEVNNIQYENGPTFFF